MDTLIYIKNDGANITYTNYFQTRAAQAGYIFVSLCPGTFRIFVPDRILPYMLKEIAKVDEVIVSRGPLFSLSASAAYTIWPGIPASNGRDALEFLFEDNTKMPFCVHIGTDQVDIVPGANLRDRKGQPHRWRCTIWNEKIERVADFPCRYRIVKRLPWLKHWSD